MATKAAPNTAVDSGARAGAKSRPKERSAARLRPAAVEPAKAANPAAQAKPAKPVKRAVRSAAKADSTPATSQEAGSAKPKDKKPDRPAAKTQAKPRAKLVRDSFTMPQADFALIDVLKKRALEFKRPTKKSELLRAGLQALAALPAQALESRLASLVELKTGRPRKGD